MATLQSSTPTTSTKTPDTGASMATTNPNARPSLALAPEEYQKQMAAFNAASTSTSSGNLSSGTMTGLLGSTPGQGGMNSLTMAPPAQQPQGGNPNIFVPSGGGRDKIPTPPTIEYANPNGGWGATPQGPGRIMAGGSGSDIIGGAKPVPPMIQDVGAPIPQGTIARPEPLPMPAPPAGGLLGSSPTASPAPGYLVGGPGIPNSVPISPTGLRPSEGAGAAAPDRVLQQGNDYGGLNTSNTVQVVQALAAAGNNTAKGAFAQQLIADGFTPEQIAQFAGDATGSSVNVQDINYLLSLAPPVPKKPPPVVPAPAPAPAAPAPAPAAPPPLPPQVAEVFKEVPSNPKRPVLTDAQRRALKVFMAARPTAQQVTQISKQFGLFQEDFAEALGMEFDQFKKYLASYGIRQSEVFGGDGQSSVTTEN